MEIQAIELTSAEIAALWASYLNNSSSIGVIKHFKETVENNEMKEVVKNTLKRAEATVEKISDIFTKENIPIPQGFIESDVSIDAPKLFSDTYMISFLYHMSVLGNVHYPYAVSQSTRPDVRALFNYCIDITQETQNEAVNLSLEKGFHIKPPSIIKPRKVNFVESGKFLKDKRPLSAIEISHLSANVLNNSIGKFAMIAFSQVAKSKEVTKLLIKGKDIATKHIKIFTDLLEREDIQAPKSWAFKVTDSKIPPYSDKLMLFLATTLMSSGVGNYGMSLSLSQRKDLGLDYSRLMVEVLQYAEDAVQLMIKKDWLEEPPLSADRNKLAKK